jgi:class 3 adenylate cyclase/predicted ATPase
MKFSEIVKQAVALLQETRRVTYRTLKREFDLDDEALEDLKFELIEGQRVAVDEDGRVLVWVGKDSLEFSVQSLESNVQKNQKAKIKRQKPVLSVVEGAKVPHPQPLAPNTQPPISYTPPHLAERIRVEQAALAARIGTDGERKTITALFADLKGSTALIEGLDPEEARSIIDPALQVMMDAVHRYDGYVAQALGDGILALFGAPIAHEDHPQRALYAALRMQEEMRRYADSLREKGYSPLLMRVGVNTGEVVVRSIRKEDLHTDYVPVGHSINLAARMEQLTAPGSILVMEQTHKLSAGYFEFKALGKTLIKGVEEPLHVYEVLGAGPLRTRLQMATRRGLTRFVGRHREMDQLQQTLGQAKAGQGQIVGVMGEPGLGKSRLFYEFKLGSPSGCLVLEAYSVSYGKASPYLPVIELLKAYFQIQPQDEERQQKERVTGKVLTLDRSLENTLPYLFTLLGIDDQQANLRQMDAQIRRRRTFDALKRLFLRESLNQPLVLIFEDLHWIDSETQGFLDVLAESVASARILLLVNYRPEYHQEWGQKTYYTQLRLAPFGKEEAEEFLTVLLGENRSPLPGWERPVLSPVEGDRVRVMKSDLQALKRLILEKTEGTPFFMEEVVQELFEQGVLVRDGVETRCSAPLPTDLRLPPTVQGILAARIDRLAPEEKALLQHLAVIGREFPLSLVKHVVILPEDELYRLLSSLQRKEFLYEQPAFPEVEYTFKHALTQEVAYNSVLHERRKALHERIAQAMEALYSKKFDEHYSELAHHYSRSGNTEQTVHYLGLAAEQALCRSAYSEAVAQLTTAVEALKTLPETPARLQKELPLQISLAATLQIIKGPGAPEVIPIYIRARELREQFGETSQSFSILRGLWQLHTTRAEVRAGREVGEQLLRLAQEVQDPDLLLDAHRALGETLFFLGEYVLAREHFEAGAALSGGQQPQGLVFRGASSVGCRGRNARTLWPLGYPDQALAWSQTALTLASTVSDPLSMAYAYYDAFAVHHLRRESQAVREYSEQLTALAQEHDLAFHVTTGILGCGLALIDQGQIEEGIRQMQQGLSALQQLSGAKLPWIVWSAPLAEAYGKIGQVEEGKRLISYALTMTNQTGARVYEAELYRLRGELTLRQFQVPSSKFKVDNPQSAFRDPQSEAEACFLKAIDIAQKQQAKSLELRATMSLARLWQQQDKTAEAHHMLSELYHWFTEGFDTKDLQEAKALLEELSH